MVSWIGLSILPVPAFNGNGLKIISLVLGSQHLIIVFRLGRFDLAALCGCHTNVCLFAYLAVLPSVSKELDRPRNRISLTFL